MNKETKESMGEKVTNQPQSAGQPVRRTLGVFALASFLNDLGSDIIYPVWPLFVTTVLRANMTVLGFLDGLGDALVSLSQAASGYLADRTGRRKIFIWTGYLCGSLSRLGYALSTAWPHLIPFRMLDRMGKIRSAPRDAIVADLSSETNRGRHFGLLRAMDNLGAAAGILLCILLINLLGYRRLFTLAAIPSLISSLLIILFIKERRETDRRLFPGISFRDLNRDLRVYFLLSAIFSFGAFSYSFLLIRAKEDGFGVTFVPVLYLIFTATAAIFSFPFGRLADRIGRRPVLFMANLLWALVCLGFILLHRLTFLAGLFFLYGLHKAALEPVQRTIVSELAPLPLRASFLGAFQMTVGLCALPASFVAGLLWEKLGGQAPFLFSIGLTLVSSLLLFLVKESQQKEARS